MALHAGGVSGPFPRAQIPKLPPVPLRCCRAPSCPHRYEEIQRAQEELGAGMVEVAAEARRALATIQQANADMAKKLLQVAAPGQVSSTQLPAWSSSRLLLVSLPRAPSRAGRCPHGADGTCRPAAGTAGTGWSPGARPGGAGAGGGHAGAVGAASHRGVPYPGSWAAPGPAGDSWLHTGNHCSPAGDVPMK